MPWETGRGDGVRSGGGGVGGSVNVPTAKEGDGSTSAKVSRVLELLPHLGEGFVHAHVLYLHTCAHACTHTHRPVCT